MSKTLNEARMPSLKDKIDAKVEVNADTLIKKAIKAIKKK